MRTLACLMIMASAAMAQTGVEFVGATSTNIVLSYTAPNSSPCTIKASEDPSFTTLVHDVDPVLFPGSNLDNRPGSLVDGLHRTVVLGRDKTELGADGKLYSRALQQGTQHSISIKCPGGPGWNGRFSTAVLPLDVVGPWPIQYCDQGWEGTCWPTTNFNNREQEYIDPETGVKLRRITDPADSAEGINNVGTKPYIAPGVVGAWTLGAQPSAGPDTYVGNGGPTDALYFSLETSGKWPSAYWDNKWNYAGNPLLFELGTRDLNFVLQTSGAGRSPAYQSCLTRGYGMPCLAGGFVTRLSPKAKWYGTPRFPSSMYAAWGVEQAYPMNISPVYTSQISVHGTSVTKIGTKDSDDFPTELIGTALFDRQTPYLKIPGSTCPQQLCPIAAIQDNQHLTLAASPGLSGNQTAIYYGLMIKMWPTAGTTRMSIQSSSVSVAIAPMWTTQVEGNWKNPRCIKGPMVEYEADGRTRYPEGPQQAYACFVGRVSAGGATTDYYLFFPRTGEARLITHMTNGRYFDVDAHPSEGDGFMKWTVKSSSGPEATCTYNASAAHWAAWSDGGRQYEMSPNVSCAPSTAHPPPDLTLLQKLGPKIDFSYYGGSYTRPVGSTSSWPFYSYIWYKGQGRQYWSCSMDASKKGEGQFLGCYNSWSNKVWTKSGPQTLALSPFRWSVTHAYPCCADIIWRDFDGQPYNHFSPQRMLDGTASDGIYQLVIDAVYADALKGAVQRSGTAITASQRDPNSCQALGVSPNSFQAKYEQATGHNCIMVHVAYPPLQFKPSNDKLGKGNGFTSGPGCGDDCQEPVAWPHNSKSCSVGAGDGENRGYPGGSQICAAYLTDLKPGDWLTDNTSAAANESFGVALAKSCSAEAPCKNGEIYGQDLVLSRAVYNAKSGVKRGAGPANHANGWMPIMDVPFSGWQWNNAGNDNNASSVSAVTASNMFDYTALTYHNPLNSAQHTCAFVDSERMYHFAGDESPGYVTLEAPYSVYNVLSAPYQNTRNYAVPFDAPEGSKQLGWEGMTITYQFLQSHIGCSPYGPDMSPANSHWMVNEMPLGGAYGGPSAPLFEQRMSLVPGTKWTYEIQPPCGGSWCNSQGYWGVTYGLGLDRKRRQTEAYAGIHLLQDVSGPKSSQAFPDRKLFTWCVADFAGECVKGSQKGNMYAVLPGADTKGTCAYSYPGMQPCAGTFGPQAGEAIQFSLHASGMYGTGVRYLGMLFNGPTRGSNYQNLHLASDGSFAIGQAWEDGVAQDLWAIYLPRSMQMDGEDRTRFVMVRADTPHQANAVHRARFGYMGLSPDPAQPFYCSSRRDQCSTAVPKNDPDPYVWLSEPQQWSPASDLYIPALPNHVLYWEIDTSTDGGKTYTSSATQVTVVR